MLVLSLDTTTRAGSIAVVEDGRIRGLYVGDAVQTHGQRLPNDLARALDDAGVPLARVDVFAVAAGPGSFTGLRVGIAAMQGLAMATARTIVPVSTLEALAVAAGAEGTAGPVAAWIDAQRGQVFAAVSEPDGRALIAPSSLSPEETLEAWRGQLPAQPVTFIGDGAVRYADVIRRAGPAGAALNLVMPPLAGVIGLMAAAHPERAVLPHAVVPIYVRRPDAELARLRNPPPDRSR